MFMRLAQFIGQCFTMPVFVWSKDKLDAGEFEQQHCFQPDCQPRNTAAYLEKLIHSLDRPTLLHVQETMGTTILLLYIEETVVLMGPFTESEWSEHIAESSLSKVGSSASFLLQYKNYYCSYSVWNPETVIQAVLAYLCVEGVDTSQIAQDNVTVAPHRGKEVHELVQDDETAYINARYQLEGAFMDAVQRGNAAEAMEALTQIRRLPPRGSYNKNNVFSQTVGFTIWRTFCRIAARQSGLPPVIIDAISQEYLQKLYSLEYGRPVEHTSALIEEMVLRFCSEIKEFKRISYPVLVRKAIDYIKLNLGANLTTSTVAQQIDVAPAYLSKQFKNATGVTLTQFIQQRRMMKAAELLCQSDNSIQDISSYVGYEDNNYFVKVFKGQHGITPSEYRNKYMP